MTDFFSQNECKSSGDINHPTTSMIDGALSQTATTQLYQYICIYSIHTRYGSSSLLSSDPCRPRGAVASHGFCASLAIAALLCHCPCCIMVVLFDDEDDNDNNDDDGPWAWRGGVLEQHARPWMSWLRLHGFFVVVKFRSLRRAPMNGVWTLEASTYTSAIFWLFTNIGLASSIVVQCCGRKTSRLPYTSLFLL